MALTTRLSRPLRLLVPLLVAALVAAAALTMFSGPERKHLTATFPRTVSLYEGSDVRILGVPVGRVDAVVPSGTVVKVTMSYDAKYDVPADANAVLVSPAIVGDRFVQLTPVYRSGDKLADGAVLDVDHTEVPLELDQIYQSIDDLTVALGPDGANRKGALTRLLDVTANNLAGQGEQFHQTVEDLGKLTGTLADNKDELFGTAREIETFVGALAANDATVRDFNDSLAAASGVLEDERADLAAALRNLGVAMRNVSSFVRENRDVLSQDIKGLGVLAKILVKQRAALDETLRVAPLTLDNLYHTYNNRSGTLDTRANLGENINDVRTRPDVVLCGLVSQVDPRGRLCAQIKGLAGRAAALGSGPRRTHAVQVEYVDRSLAGLLEVGR